MAWRFDAKGNAIPTTIEEQQRVCDQISIRNHPTSTSVVYIDQKEVGKSRRNWDVIKL
jgi:hypothetical protein